MDAFQRFTRWSRRFRCESYGPWKAPGHASRHSVLGFDGLGIVRSRCREGIAVLVRIWTRWHDDIAATEPAQQVEIGAGARAERSELLGTGRLANRAAATGWLRAQSGLRGRIRFVGHDRVYSGSASAAFSQFSWIGKLSPLSIATTSVSGSPTTLVYEPVIFWTKQPARPWMA